jgi:protein-S-isoprenylcysteine O-methyltransferase Ste14
MADVFFLGWGMLVTAFLLIAAILTARTLLNNYLAEREEKRLEEERIREVAESNSGL